MTVPASPDAIAITATPKIVIETSNSRSVSPASPEALGLFGTAHTFTWRKTPYIADTKAMATNPTIRPMTTMTIGSKSEVSFLIL